MCVCVCVCVYVCARACVCIQSFITSDSFLNKERERGRHSLERSWCVLSYFSQAEETENSEKIKEPRCGTEVRHLQKEKRW